MALLLAPALAAACSLGETIGRHSVAYNSSVGSGDGRRAA
jgi:hypothetical protein